MISSRLIANFTSSFLKYKNKRRCRVKTLLSAQRIRAVDVISSVLRLAWNGNQFTWRPCCYRRHCKAVCHIGQLISQPLTGWWERR